MPAGYVFVLGAFDTGFTPDESNTEQWLANWSSAGHAIYKGAPYHSFSQLTNLPNTADFPAGGQVYIWGYDNTGEWILLKSPDWQWPAGGEPSPTISWATVGQTTAILGQIDTSDAHLVSAQATGDVPLVTPEQWRAAQFTAGDDSAWESDPDNDGKDNWLEFALGTMPLRHDGSVEPVLCTFDSNRFLGLDFAKPPHAGVVYKLLASADLLEWGSDIIEVENSKTRFTAHAADPLGSTGRCFVRLSADTP